MIKIFQKYSSLYIVLILVGLSACKTIKTTESANNSNNTIPTKTISKGKDVDTANVERNFIDGCKFIANSDFDNAIKSFNEVLKLDPNNAASMYQLSTIYFQYGQAADAMEYIKNAVRIEPQNFYYQLLYADIFTYNGYFDKSADVYERLLSENKNNEEIYYRLAFNYEKGGRLNDAINTMKRLREIVGNDEGVLFELQRLYSTNNQFDEAIEITQQLISIDPQNPTYLRYLSEYYERAGKPELAEETFDKLLQSDTNNTDLQFRKASLEKKAGKTKEYYSTMHTAFGNQRGNIDTKIFYLVLYVDSIDNPVFKLKDTVFTWTELLVEAHPEDAKSYAMRGDFLFYAGKLNDAAETYRKSMDIRSDIYDVWIKLFYIYSDLRQYDSLKAVTSGAMELYPNQALSYYFNAVASNNLKDYETSVKVLKRGLPLTVSNIKLRADMYTELGDAYNELKNYEESDKAFESSLQLNPNNPYTLNNYAYYLSMRNENLEKAAQMSVRSIELVPNNSSLEDTYAWILYKQKKYNDAKKWLALAMSHGGEKSAIIAEHYGDVLFKLGNTEEAVEYWKKAKQLGENSESLEKKINDKMLYE